MAVPTLACPALAPRVGFYGKLPVRGDFLRIGLPRTFLVPWDAWLQRTLPAALTALGDAWLEAPAWRFALPPGLCGPAPVLGVLLPSMDAVGRSFPLTIARTGGQGRVDDAFLDAAEAAGRSAIADAWPPDTLSAALPATEISAGHPAGHQPKWWRGTEDIWTYGALPDARTLAVMLNAEKDTDHGQTT